MSDFAFCLYPWHWIPWPSAVAAAIALLVGAMREMRQTAQR